MGIVNNALAGASGQGGGYNLTRSLRFRSSASAYLNRTFGSGNRQTWTYSTWVKRGALGSSDKFLLQTFGAGGFGVSGYIRFNSDDTMKFFFDYNGGSPWQLTTTQVFRDPSAWYHIVVVADTTNATSSNRLRLYVNGPQITSFSSSNYPSQNANGTFNQAYAHYIGQQNNTDYFDGYQAETNFIDGQALTPSSFGETSTTTGVWQPIEYAGTYGTNGFYLPFTNTASTSTLGNDFSGNGNNWTTNNFSLTAGATYDSMTDVPTLTDESTANYCVLNPLVALGTRTISNGNLNVSISSLNTNVFGTMQIPTSGKWYWEYQITTIGGGGSSPMGGVAEGFTSSTTTASFYRTNGNLAENGGDVVGYGATYGTSDIIGVAANADAGTVTWYKNGVSQGARSFNPAGLFPAVRSNAATDVFVANFGQRPFAYTPPTGFVALNTFNLPTPTIGATASTQANKYFDVSLYTGTGSAQSITGLNFQPDWVWIKERSSTGYPALFDSVRGATVGLSSATTGAEYTDANSLTAFNSNGFSVGSGGGTFYVNRNTQTYVAWDWKANGTGVTNTAGSITSTVSANTSSGFSVVTYTGTGSNATVGHGLGVAPKMVIIKQRNGTGSWVVWQTSYSPSYRLDMESTNALFGPYSTFMQDTVPSSTVVYLGTNGNYNGSGSTYVMYAFSEIAGYSKFGSYTGNGSTDGTFVYTGFRPKYIMIKKTATGGGDRGWLIEDSSRSPYNAAELFLYANASDAESNNQQIDFLSNGFKIRNNGIVTNDSGITMIYAAFAENPFKYSLAR